MSLAPAAPAPIAGWRLRNVAAVACQGVVSPRSFARHFRTQTGITPYG